MIKPEGIRWVGYPARIGEVLWENLKERDRFHDLSVDGWMILERILGQLRGLESTG
jgi:hypothetical protein